MPPIHGNTRSAVEDTAGIERNATLTNKGSSIPDRVALLYYKHGLLCSTYPWWAIFVAIIIVVASCYPLLSLPFPGNEPEELPIATSGNVNIDNYHTATSTSPSYQYPARWRTQQPAIYIQQVVIRSAVNPWSSNLDLMDAFRGPLGIVFQVVSTIKNFHSQQTNLTLREVCLYVQGLAPIARSFQTVLPEYSCLVLSPAHLWQLDQNVFQKDASFLDTIFSYKNPVEVRSSVADMLFGVSLKDSGIKKYPVKTRSRVLTYAITLILKSHSEQFLTDLRLKLYNLYPVYSNVESSDWRRRTMIHVYYPERFNYLELIPLTVVYFILFLYIYFSVRKIEMVKSKLGMAFSAVVTVIASLGMSVGLCAWFGLRFTLQGRDVIPYIIVIIGLENILVLTRSVVSTPVNLDVKIRVAQGLSREGWNITKNLLTEVTILTVGFFTFVPAIQEFCIFAVVALLSDFILQMVFFATVLSIDILRMELSDLQRHRRQPPTGHQYSHTVAFTNDRVMLSNTDHPHLRPRSHTSPKTMPTAIVASPYTTSSAIVKVPRRLKIVHFWARTRFFQRTFMVGMVIWMGIFFYKYVVVAHFTSVYSWSPVNNVSISKSCSFNCDIDVNTSQLLSPDSNTRTNIESDGDLTRLQHPNIELWRRLSYRHWPDLLALYNFSLAGSCIALLPSIRLSIPVHPDQVQDVRNIKDSEYLSQSRWKSLATALDSLDVLDGEDSDFGSSKSTRTGSSGTGNEKSWDEDAPFVPSSPLEIILTSLLAIPSIAFLAYVMVVLYRCICSRHYAEWRSNWWENGGVSTQEYYSQVVAESMPLVLDGHRAPVECVATDGNIISSVCLGGQLRIWDIQTGEALAQIDRNTYFCSDEQQERGSPALVNQLSPGSLSLSSSLEKIECRSNQGSFYISHPSSQSFTSSPSSPNNPFEKYMDFPLRKKNTTSPVWCIQCFDDLVALGCGNGRIEIWNGSVLKCLYDDGSGVGVVKLKYCGDFLVVARLSGVLETLQLQYSSSDVGIICHRRTVGMEENTSQPNERSDSLDVSLRLVRFNWTRAHQQPITVLDSEGGRIVTGSQDHCIKVWRLETLTGLYNLHGHCGPITALFIDNANPSASGSGSQDGMLCLWDLASGTCVYNLQAHDGSVLVLAYNSSYVISLGSDDKLCVWERFQGHLLHTLPTTKMCCSSLAMLSDRLIVTSRQGSLIVWDVRTGEPIRVVLLGDADNSTFIRQILVVRENVICDYGTQLRIVSFPMISTQKIE